MKTTLKFIAIILTAFAFTMCNTKQNENKETTTTKSENFDWLLGKWQRTNEKQGKTTFENWEKISDSEYSGIGFTIQKNDTISQETMRILETDGKWNLLVKIPKEKEFIKFEMSEIKEDKFEFKNDTLDFPKLIKYWKKGDKINALVSGDSLKLSFEFKRLE
ncbi:MULTISPECIES: DUF6265 family protein [unclassified Empedobacter]|uniref:DUF6265 family protein n=1 Tax=unclassified Empedobacter TaxID=2643773 RepID=UPI002449F923|nr:MULTISPECIES: DUF6265 family protein [unclassified Empedobacter]MDH0674141.1 DUF6265 family protein [Empedobacter sp. GD03861]MDH1602493.1 DUF6265 family protein [Empedobacter sp. GD03739]